MHFAAAKEEEVGGLIGLWWPHQIVSASIYGNIYWQDC